MYDNVKHLGKTLKEWQEFFHNQFSLGQLYRMHIGKIPWPKIW